MPTDADWTALEDYLIANGYNYDGPTNTTEVNKIAKSMAAGIWQYSAVTGSIGNDLSLNNISGFSALPGGSRADWGAFSNLSHAGRWWSATEGDASIAWCRYLFHNSRSLVRFCDQKRSGFSVRLVRDLN